MAQFCLSVSRENIAGQVADLVNRYNRLYVTHTPYSIMKSKPKYFVHLEGDRVIGCAACLAEYPTLSKIMHVCVHPDRRRSGIAQKLVTQAISACTTENVYATIRENNVASRRLMTKIGFVQVKITPSKDHYIVVYGRRKDI